MKKILMTASEASHFKNFHIPYIKYLLNNNIEVYTASRGNFNYAGVHHIEIPYKKKLLSLGNIGTIFKLASIIRKNNFDAVYANSTLAGFIGRTAVGLCGKKTKAIHICHGYLFDDDKSLRSRLYVLFEKLVKNRTDILAVMNSDDYQIAEKYRLSKNIVFINGMGLSAEKFAPVTVNEIDSFKKEHKIGENEYLFLCVGEFSERKHQQTIIEACSLIENDNFKVIFAGDGSLLDFCKELSRKKRVDDKTLFLGHCSNVNLLYRACGCLISASRYEGMPFNVMEALYCGEDAILTDVKGNRDLALEHNLRTYNFSDPTELSRHMSDLLRTHSQDRKSISDKGKTESRLNPKYLIENTLSVNLSLLGMTDSASNGKIPKPQ